MEEDEFLAMIAKHGAQNILAINYDNTGRVTFHEDRPFDLATMYDPTTKCIEVIVTATGGRPNEILSIKPLNCIQGVVIRTPNTVLEDLDTRMVSN